MEKRNFSVNAKLLLDGRKDAEGFAAAVAAVALEEVGSSSRKERRLNNEY